MALGFLVSGCAPNPPAGPVVPVRPSYINLVVEDPEDARRTPLTMPSSYADFVVLSDPPGARIVVDGEEAGTAPTAVHHRRDITHGLLQRMVVRALSDREGLCPQTRVVDFSVPVGDTMRFDLHRCPPRDQDLTRVFGEEEVDEPPERLWTQAERYPERMRLSRTDGAVIFEVVIDSTGRAERGSFLTILATQNDFVPSARQMAFGSAFRPGRLLGRPVRVRIAITGIFSVWRF